MVIDSQRLVSKWVRVNISSSQKMMASFRTDQEKPYMGSIGTQSSVAIYTQEISPEMYLYKYIYIHVYTHICIYIYIYVWILDNLFSKWFYDPIESNPDRFSWQRCISASVNARRGFFGCFFFPWFCVLWRLNGGLMVFNGVLGCLMMFNGV